MDETLQILIVEDDLVVARLQKFGLERLITISPVMCKNGREAIEVLDSVVGKTDCVLVLLDLNMPEMNGWDFLEACKEKSYSNKVHVVVVTSSLFREDQRKAAEYEQVIGYFTKPITTPNFQLILNLPEISADFNRILKSGT